MHVVVEQPLTASGTGHISCRPLGQHPITFEWYTPDGSALELTSQGSEALHVPVGRYRVEATDATGACADVLVDVEAMFSDAVVIEGYNTTPASTTFARDGSVEVLGRGLDGWRFLWTGGVQTTEPLLRDVGRGTYTAVPLADAQGKVPVVVHMAEPAHVVVSGQGRWGVG